ncbi:MAG: hypothetical protein ACAH11_14250 [Sphingomonas sp.]
MSTIIEWCGRAGLVLAAWLLILLAMPFVGPSGRDVAVVGDTAQAIAAIRTAGGSVVDIRKGAVLARSDRPGFAAALYHGGAHLVIEGRIGAGCFGKR